MFILLHIQGQSLSLITNTISSAVMMRVTERDRLVGMLRGGSSAWTEATARAGGQEQPLLMPLTICEMAWIQDKTHPCESHRNLKMSFRVFPFVKNVISTFLFQFYLATSPQVKPMKNIIYILMLGSYYGATIYQH